MQCKIEHVYIVEPEHEYQMKFTTWLMLASFASVNTYLLILIFITNADCQPQNGYT